MTAIEASLDVIADFLTSAPGCVVERHAPSANHSTYRCGGPLDVFVSIENEAGLASLLNTPGLSAVPLLMVGRGSNLLVADEGFHGVAVALGDAFARVDAAEPDDAGKVNVTIGGAAALPVVARATVGIGLTGFEWAVGVPGSMGGAVRMNAGGHGSDIAANLVSCEVADFALGGFVQRSAESLQLAYRHSSIQPWELVVNATLELCVRTGDHPQVEGNKELSEIVRWRREHQPGGANAGSVFTNPNDDSAGRLIDASGLKGFRYGGATISDKHANFIQADPDATASDIVAVMVRAIDVVEAHHGVRLVPETRLVGFDPSTCEQLGIATFEQGSQR